MTDRILVPFAGEGCGVAQLSWGMRELWGGMQRQHTWMPLGSAVPLPPGTTVEDIAGELRFLMERYPSARTRLRLRPPTPMPPFEQARWQSSEAGRRANAAVLRHWENTLRTIAPRRFPGPVDPREPRHWCAGFTSRALHLAARSIARRTGTESSHVLLAAFAAALARQTGIDPVVIRMVVSNRFRPGLAATVSPIVQTGLCLLDVVGAPFDELVGLARRRVVSAYKYAYYDPNGLDTLLARVGRERGEDVDIACYFNDRRLRGRDDGAPAPGATEIRAALDETTFRWISRLDVPSERLFLHINDVPDTVDITLFADTHHLSPASMQACVRGMEEIAVRAALPPVARPGSGAC